ncbi:MAG: cation transporter [Rhodobacteraceae bacterium]|nr:cation transporter [Paracoccaceae bacterium]
MPYSLRVLRIARASVLVALAVMGLKAVAWWLTGSVALYADALESSVNVVTAGLALWAVHISRIPPDAEHHYGHHKVEYFAAVAEGVMIVLAALLIFREAWGAFQAPVGMGNAGAGMAVNAVAAAINLAWARLLIRVGQREGSPALEADGRHVMTDVATSAGVLAGLVLAWISGWPVLDAVLGAAVGLHILNEGRRLIAASLDGLMDRAATPDETALIEATIRDSAAGALEVHDIRTRRAGPAMFIDFHLVVDGAMSVSQSHEICDRVEAALGVAVPGARVAIHVEPAHKRKPDHGLDLV